MTALATCQCDAGGTDPQHRCGQLADAEDLLCTPCRQLPEDVPRCVVVVITQSGERELAGHAQYTASQARTPGATIKVLMR